MFQVPPNDARVVVVYHRHRCLCGSLLPVLVVVVKLENVRNFLTILHLDNIKQYMISNFCSEVLVSTFSPLLFHH